MDKIKENIRQMMVIILDDTVKVQQMLRYKFKVHIYNANSRNRIEYDRWSQVNRFSPGFTT